MHPDKIPHVKNQDCPVTPGFTFHVELISGLHVIKYISPHTSGKLVKFSFMDHTIGP